MAEADAAAIALATRMEELEKLLDNLKLESHVGSDAASALENPFKALDDPNEGIKQLLRSPVGPPSTSGRSPPRKKKKEKRRLRPVPALTPQRSVIVDQDGLAVLDGDGRPQWHEVEAAEVDLPSSSSEDKEEEVD
jgi:hypothetical protein